MTGFDTPIPFMAIVAWCLLLVLVLAWGQWRFASVIRPAYRLLLVGTRLGTVLLMLILLLQPYRTVRTPDRDSFHVAVLADCSHSMNVADCASGTSRFEVLAELLGGTRDSLWDRLGRQYRVEPFAFSEKLHPLGGVVPGKAALPASSTAGSSDIRLTLLPGRTAIGDVLAEAMTRYSTVPLGAVLLLSDGQANYGQAVSEACKRYGARGIPVSCVGIGEQSVRGDVRVRFAEDSVKAVKGKPFTLNVMVENTLPRPVRSHVELSDGKAFSAYSEVEVPALGGVGTVEFTVTPWRAGTQTFAARLRPVEGDDRPDTDVDYTSVSVDEPDVFQILYLGAHLNWEYKFLKVLVEATEQLTLASVIRTGKDTFLSSGLPGSDTDKGFPQSQVVFNRFDALLLDTRAIPLMSAQTLEAIATFVEYRGGGLLCFGPLEDIPVDFANLLPVAGAQTGQPGQDLRIEFNRGFIFDRDPGGVLHPAQGVALPRGQVSILEEPKLGARAAATVRNTGQTVLVAQSYGSGRVAVIGPEGTWRWRLVSAAGADVHDAFWRALLVWLGSTRKARVTAACTGVKAAVGEEIDLGLTVLGTDFRPAPDARIRCEIAMPSGEVAELLLDPSAEAPGQYEGRFFPTELGEHAVRYHIRLLGEELHSEAYFLARSRGVEADDVSYREDVLRDIARITNGSFWHYSEAGTIHNLPLSGNIPYTTRKVLWTRSSMVLALLVAMLGFDWYCRRRIGLK